MIINDTRISQNLRNKGQLTIEKDIKKCEKITATLLDKTSVSSYKSRQKYSEPR